MTVATTAPPSAENFTVIAALGNLAQNAQANKLGFPVAEGRVMEPKLDGWRILAHVGEDKVNFFSRSGKSYNGKLAKIEAELLANCPSGTWLDGEVCSLTVHENGSITDEWGSVQSVLASAGGKYAATLAEQISFMVFDLLAHGGIDARTLRFQKRRALLNAMFANATFDRVKLIAQFPATPAVYESLVEKGYEGAISKRLDKPYLSGKRDGSWIKLKPTKTVEGVVMGFQPGKDGFAGMVGAVIFGQYNDAGVLVERGKVSGMDMKTRLSMTNHPGKWVGTVIEVAHEGVSIGATDSGRFRFPRFKRTRPDRSPESVTIHDY